MCRHLAARKPPSLCLALIIECIHLQRPATLLSQAAALLNTKLRQAVAAVAVTAVAAGGVVACVLGRLTSRRKLMLLLLALVAPELQP